MAGLILYSVNPRSLGTLPEWTAAVLEAEKLGCNAIHVNPFHPVTAEGKEIKGRKFTGSLYALRDHFTINKEFCGGANQATAWYQLRDFIKLAHAKYMRIMADLPLHHLAVDHPLVASHPEFFKRNPDGSLHMPGPADNPWSEAAAIDYHNPNAWNYFLGEGGYWLRLMDQYLELGFNAFRCDLVYWLPQLVWEQVLNYAHRREPEILVLAEALGLSGQDAELMQETLRESDARIVYDICYDDVGREWGARDISALKSGRAGRLDQAAHYGTMGFVDAHDFTPRAAELRAQLGTGEEADQKIAARCIRDYAVACFTNPSVMLQRGYQWCVEDNIGTYREQVSAEFFKSLKHERKIAPSPLTISAAIVEMHRLRAQIPPQISVEFSRLHMPEYKNLTAMQCDFYPIGSEQIIASIILLLNTTPEEGPQKFPESWWLDFKGQQSNAQRWQFGPDRKMREQISSVAVLMVPGGITVNRQLNPSHKAALNPAAEATLVA